MTPTDDRGRRKWMRQVGLVCAYLSLAAAILVMLLGDLPRLSYAAIAVSGIISVVLIAGAGGMRLTTRDETFGLDFPNISLIAAVAGAIGFILFKLFG